VIIQLFGFHLFAKLKFDAIVCVVKCCQRSCDFWTRSAWSSTGVLWQEVLLWQRSGKLDDYQNNAVN